MLYLLLEADYSLARRLIREIMQLRFEAVWTQRPDDAQLLIGQQRFDLVILSLRRVDQTAREIFAKLNHPDRRTPFVVLLENMTDKDRRQILDLGAVTCLGKPLAPWALTRHLRVILQSVPKRPTDNVPRLEGAHGRLRATPPPGLTDQKKLPMAV